MTILPINTLIVPQIEKLAWTIKAVEPDAAFWLARGQLSKLSNDIDAARRAINKSLELDRTFVQARFEFAIIEREGGNLAGAQAILEAEDGRYLEEGSDVAALGRLIAIDQELKMAPGGIGKIRKERVKILMRLGIWEEAISEIKELFISGKEPDVDYRMLYDCYKGIGESRLALAAAEAHNADSDNRSPIPIVEIENLRWRHRDEKPEAHLTGRFDILLELSKDEEALALARREGWLSNEEGKELSAENAERLKVMEGPLQMKILKLLERLDLTEEAATVRKLIKTYDLSSEDIDLYTKYIGGKE
jgi:tetratricopeptide (TPR) repeat protein